MSPTLDAFLRSWPFDPTLLIGLAVTAGIYLRGWRVLARRDPTRWHSGQAAAFVGGLVALDLALASPIAAFAGLLLQLHMVQHLLLMMAAPPLLWLGAPLFPLLRGLPAPVRSEWVAPLLRDPALRAFFQRLTHPAAALPILIAASWLWHVPAAYALALRSEAWHYVQHACFFAAGLLFWYPVVRPYPSRPRWSPWLLVPYLILADVQNTVLSALLTFADHVIYPHYAQVPRLGGIKALADQAAAGMLMWVPGSLAYLLPLFAIGVRLLSGLAGAVGKRATPHAAKRIALPLVAPTRTGVPDVLRVPLLGRFLRWRHARLAMQLPLAALALLVFVDGVWGTPISPLNLAGVLPWIHWRGAVMVGLLVAGNLFCMACPFMLPRTLARHWLPAGWAWPRRLRSKWLAVLLLGLFLWAYEALALWDSPWWTAWIVGAYFSAAFVVDGFFRGASFCKYLCPIGQFNFVQSLVSPVEVAVRDPAVCAACRTRDCIRGRDGIPGCELNLDQPRKTGNMDCTFCLDCVHACPHDNVGLLVGLPGRDLQRDVVRSGIGRFANRPDLAALVLVLVFGAFANAAGMVEPVVAMGDRLQRFLGLATPFAVISAYYVAALFVLPLILVGGAAHLTQRWADPAVSRLETAVRYSFAFVPIGFGMWLAHYTFHLTTSYDAVIPASVRLLADVGWAGDGDGLSTWSCCRTVGAAIYRIEIICLDGGLLLSLYTAYRIALARSNRPRHALGAMAPWGVLIGLLFVIGIWIVLQPMQMRGTPG